MSRIILAIVFAAFIVIGWYVGETNKNNQIDIPRCAK